MDFLDVIGRFDTGPIIAEKDFDSSLFNLAHNLKEEFDIKYMPTEPVKLDAEMADRLFEAALKLFLDLGVYCIDTRKVCKFTMGELEKRLDQTPDRVKFGRGNDERVMRHRTVADSTPPFCSPNPVGTPVREELFETVLYSYASVPYADTFSGPSLLSLGGRPVESGTPAEIEAAIWNIQKIDQARQAAGRPGMGCHNFISCAEKTDAIIASARHDFGAKPGDGLLNGAIAEMKVDYERLKKVAFMRKSGLVIGGLYGPLMGGYAGGPEETAIVLAAHHFLGLMAFDAKWHDSFPININQVCNTESRLLWISSITGQALSRNTRFPVMNACFTSAGPCTPMLFDELCAHTVTVVASGFNINPMAPARNRHPERCSGMEAWACCEIGHAVAKSGIGLDEIGVFVKKLLEGYEKQIPDAPLGKTFEECYDVKKCTPSPEYQRLYDEAKNRWAGMGFTV
jgi:methylamine--corrinoid protein Co-methyltransferase